jgi:hypothetical protein
MPTPEELEQQRQDEAKRAADEAARKAAAAPKTFTQEEVNALLAKERRKNEAAAQEQLQALERERQRADLTQREKERLDAEIAAREAQLGEEEKAKRGLDKQRRDAEEKAQAAMRERDEFRGRYQDSIVTQAILAAAEKQKAYRSQQVVALVKPMVSVDESGKAVVRVPKTDPVDGGTLYEIQSVEDYVAKMAEDGDYANLFLDPSAGGTGLRAARGSGGGQKRVVTHQMLRDGKVDPKDLESGKVTVAG